METSSEAYRLFVAIPLPAEVKAAFSTAQAEMQRALPAGCVRWTRPEQFHMTLKFLGDVSSAQTGDLVDSLFRACSGFPELNLRAERIGFFPHPRYPRVVWAWVHDLAGCLPLLQQAVEVAVESFSGQKREEKFTGHVTLGRCQGIKRPEAEILAGQAAERTHRFFGEWNASYIELIRSELSAGGSRYTVLDSIPLAAGSSSEKLPPA